MLASATRTQILKGLATLAVATTSLAPTNPVSHNLALAQNVYETSVLTAASVNASASEHDFPYALGFRYLSETQRRACRQMLSCIEDRTYSTTISNISFDDLDHAFYALRSDHPELYWLGSYHYQATGDGYTFWADTNGLTRQEMRDTQKKLDAVADDTVGSNEGAAAYKSAVTHFRLRSDNAGGAKIGTWENLCRFMHPNVFRHLFIILAKRRAKTQDKVLDPLQSLPWIGEAQKIVFGQCMVEVIEIFYRVHKILLNCCISIRAFL